MANHPDWITRGEQAADDLFSFARFVAGTEHLWQDPAQVSDGAAWQRQWFELEILNSLALDEWQQQGSPPEWSAGWQAGYQQEARQLAVGLLALLNENGKEQR